MTVLVRTVNLGKKRENVLEHPGRPAWAWFDCRKETGKVVGVASVFPPAWWVGHMMLRGRPRKHSLSGLDISLQPGPFGKEFSRLDEQIVGMGAGFVQSGGGRIGVTGSTLCIGMRFNARVKGDLRGFVVFLYGGERLPHRSVWFGGERDRAAAAGRDVGTCAGVLG